MSEATHRFVAGDLYIRGASFRVDVEPLPNTQFPKATRVRPKVRDASFGHPAMAVTKGDPGSNKTPTDRTMRRRKKKLEDEAVSLQEVATAEEVEATCCVVEAPVQECLVQILLFCPGKELREREMRWEIGVFAEALSTAKEFSLQKAQREL
ncbi:hypothetical protein AK812_SmicGene23155 [Symbiodinium microadriaticum]|uniref:Uncharacterized protein n=1 Tax=Symbiodinium microadriaticum TaxID=2951 RepID=A0A1Q9DI65_SYMMI|nr:hypothetical protein AK812_SmicGene23155 [Symbiodinium microadriaticum]